MKKLLFLISFFSIVANAQTGKGVKIGYIDMEYILEKVPDYAEANNQLEQKAQKWKQEIETKRNAITVLKDNLKTERVLLTKELIEEREEEIAFLDKELLDYQEKKFGPKGDMIIQKSVLVKPIQDQIFTIIQDVAEQRKYDFVFDRASDLTMLFADKKHNISDFVVRKLTSAQKREEMTNKQIKALEAKEALEDLVADNPGMDERQKKLDERKAAREQQIEDRKKAIDEKKAAAAEKRKKLLEDRDAKKNGTVIEKDIIEGDNNTKETPSKDKVEKAADEVLGEKKLSQAEIRQNAIDARNKKNQERKEDLEARKKKIADDKEAAKKAREQKAEEKKKD